MIHWFIGFDKRESGALYVLAHSIMFHSSMPVSITPICLDNLKGIFTRKRDPLQSTDFAFSRFLVPWMCQYEDWAVFSDCDMVLRDDPAKLWAWRDDKYAVMCVHHDHQPTEDRKFLDQAQTKYEKKNWSSVMLFNNPRCRALTPEYVNSASGLDLHQFKWLKEEEVGYLPRNWNHLVGYDEYDHKASLVHYTIGGPYFEEYKNCDYHQDWATHRSLMNSISREPPRDSDGS